MRIINSILDQDFYKFTQQNAVLRKYPGVPVRYNFTDRGKARKYNDEFARQLRKAIEEMQYLSLTEGESRWLRANAPFLGRDYLAYLQQYRFDPSQVVFVVEDGSLRMEIRGTWEETILWEVPLLAMISELYFKYCDTNWVMDALDQHARASQKAAVLSEHGVPFADFGTRRRRNTAIQEMVVCAFIKKESTFVGTSNVALACKYGLKPIGTMAHEWIMGVSALESLRYANRYAMRAWNDVYQGNLGITLTDTFGTGAFFQDFDGQLARMFDGVRHDSGDPVEFAEKAIAHYESLRINPKHKTIVFSDSLRTDTCVSLWQRFRGRIGISFGIGTHFTNDIPGSPPLNIVIKMTECNGIPVVKLSDVLSKKVGNRDALRVAMWMFYNKPLDMEDWADAPAIGAAIQEGK